MPLTAVSQGKEFRDANLTQVNANNVGADVWLVLATPVGQPDQGIPYADSLDWLKSDTGAVLEVAADGLRVSNAGLGPSMKGGGSSVINVEINEQSSPSGGVATGDKVLIWDVDAAAYAAVTVAEIAGEATGGADLSVSNIGLTTLDVVSSTGTDATLPAAVAGVSAGLMTAAQAAKLDGLSDSDFTLALSGDVTNDASQVVTISAGAVDTAELAAGAVEGSKLAAGAISAASKFTAGVVDTAALGDSQVTFEKLADDAVAGNKIAAGGINSSARFVAGVVDAAAIGTDAVTTVKILNGAVTDVKIADDAINSQHYVDGSIDTVHLADGSVTGGKIATAGIDNASYFAAGVIDTAALGNEQVTAAKIEQLKAWSLLMNNTNADASPTEVDEQDLTQSTPASGDMLFGWNAAGQLRRFDVGDLVAGTVSLNDMGNISTDTAIDFSAGTGSVKQKLTLTGNIAVTSFTAPGSEGEELLLIVAQDATGGRTIDFSAVDLRPTTEIPVATDALEKTVIKLTYVDGDVYHWEV